MLSISLTPDEYVTIGDVVVKVTKVVGSRCFLAIQADKDTPILRSAVLERSGITPPSCIHKTAK